MNSFVPRKEQVSMKLVPFGDIPLEQPHVFLVINSYAIVRSCTCTCIYIYIYPHFIVSLELVLDVRMLLLIRWHLAKGREA